MENIRKKLREIDSFHFTSFLAGTFLNFIEYYLWPPDEAGLELLAEDDVLNSFSYNFCKQS